MELVMPLNDPERIVRIEQDMISVKEDIQEVKEHVHWVRELFVGNGTPMNPGLLTKLDRCEQFIMRFGWLSRLVVGLVIAQCVVGFVAALVWVARHMGAGLP